jgi:transcription elongation factor Elf1
MPTETPNDPVDMIASGYDWTCPKCNHWNNEIEWKETVVCANAECGQSFTTNVPEHAYA